MKKTLIYVFILCSLSAQAQEITKDSTFVELIAGKYFNTRIVEYDNGSSNFTRTIFGDGTAQHVFNTFKSRLRRTAEEMAYQVEAVSKYPKQLNDLVRESADIKTLIGKSALDSIQAADIAAYIAPGWTIKQGSTTAIDIMFTVTAGGQMRHSLGATPRNVTYLGFVIRLHNYPVSGTNTDFYKIQNGNFVTSDRNLVLRKPGSSQNIIKSKKTKQ